METKTMSKESIVFESPAEVNAEVIQNGAMLLVKLEFPGLRKSDVPQPEPVRERRSFFSCFNSSEDSQPIQKCEWFKFITERRHSGEWITIPTDRQPANCELWLQVFRYRICIMLSPQNSRNPTTSDSGVTQYFFWDSGCMNKALNYRKCEMLINDDFISLRLACSKSLWGEDDVKDIEKSRRGDNSKEVNVESDRKFPEVNAVCDETYSVSTSDSVKEEKSTTINYNNLKGEGCRSKDNINEESSTQNVTIMKISPNKVASEEAPDSNLEIKDILSKKPEQKGSKQTEFIERCTSCTDMCLVVDASVATTDQKLTEEKPRSCHYCLSVQELLGKEEFSALQARVEALNKDDWARVLDIIMGKNNDVKSKSPTLESQKARETETLANNIVLFRTGNQPRPQRRIPLRNARYLVQNSNLKK